MALISCGECGAKVSTDATTCPSCGGKMPRKTSLLTWVIAGLFAFGIVSSIIGSNRARQASTEVEAAKSPEQRASEAAAQAADTIRHQAAKLTSIALRKAARDPESVKFETLRVDEKAAIVCAEFRARNGFGGMNLEHMAVVRGAPDGSVSGWNRHCTGRMYDYLLAAD